MFYNQKLLTNVYSYCIIASDLHRNRKIISRSLIRKTFNFAGTSFGMDIKNFALGDEVFHALEK